MRLYVRALLDWLLGRPCEYGCGQRLFDDEVPVHVQINHGVDKRVRR